MRTRWRVTLAASIAALSLAHAGTAEERFSIVLRAVTTRADGATAVDFQTGSTTVAGGPTVDWTVGLGRFGADGQIQDALAHPNLLLGTSPGPTPNVVRVTAGIHDADLDRITMDLRWTHLVADHADDDPSQIAADDRRVTLPEGGTRIIEVFRAERPASAEVVNAYLEIEVDRIEDSALAPAGLGYRMWVVPPADAALPSPPPTQAVAGQGERLRLGTEPSTVTLAGVTSDAGGTVTVSLSVFVEALGRLRPDGRIDLSLRAMRVVYLSAPNTPGAMLQGTAGRGLEQRLQIRPGEPIRLDLPGPPSLVLPGSFTVEPGTPGVRAESNRLIVDAADLLGDVTQVTLAVDVVPPGDE